MDDPTSEVRIGDRERREVDARLQQAYADGVLTITEYEERSALCWAARTRSELAPLTSDLPEPEPDPAAEPTVSVEKKAPATPAAVEARRKRFAGGVAAIVLVGVGLLVGGRVIGADDAVQLFGSREVVVAPGDDRVQVGLMFGSVRVTVPADAMVRTEGTLIFGSLECEDACDGFGTREVVVDAAGAFGSVSVMRPGEVLEDDNDRGRNDNDRDSDEDEDDD